LKSSGFLTSFILGTKMKRLILILALFLCSSAMAENVIRTQAPISNVGSWSPTTPLISAWIGSGAPYGCSVWAPLASTVAVGTTYTQNRSCQQNITHTVQPQEINSKSGAVRSTGTSSVENQIQIVTQNQSSQGTMIESICYYSDVAPYSTWVVGKTPGQFAGQVFATVNGKGLIGANLAGYYQGQIMTSTSGNINTGAFWVYQICKH
jgi:hypothetical protein